MNASDYDFAQGRRPGQGGGDDPPSGGAKGWASDPLAPWVSEPLQEGWAVLKGAAKGAVTAPGGIEAPDIAKWAAKEGDRPIAEDIGRQIPLAAATAILPDMPFLAAAKTAPWLWRAGSRALQNAWKGAAGGALEAKGTPKDVARGAVEGGIGASVTAPAAAAVIRPAAALAAHWLPGAHWFGPWAAYHLTHPLARYAKMAVNQLPGPIGQASEWAAKELGYEESDEGEGQGQAGQ
jgi:hypothetical protein